MNGDWLSPDLFEQVFTAVTLRDFWLDDVLPFSCCPMFMLPRNIYDDLPKWFTMTDSPVNGTNTRQSGAMEPLYWSAPRDLVTDASALSASKYFVLFGRRDVLL